MMAWLSSTAAKAGLLIALAIMAVVGVIWAFDAVIAGKSDQVKGKLDSAVADASMSNAADAVTVVQERAASETNLNIKVTNAQNAVQAATDGAGADAAGRAGLCSISAGFCPASGVQ